MEEDDGTRRSSCSTSQSSPEFEFWAPRNPAPFPNPDQLPTADKLFVNGVLLPLLSNHCHCPVSLEESAPLHALDTNPPSDETGPVESSSPNMLTSSKRWRDIIFKKTNLISFDDEGDVREKEKKTRRKEKRRGTSSAEFVINMWPFARSRSAGNDAARPKPSGQGSGRKVSSAPCSRSNSNGESKSRKLPKSPGRAYGGVLVGRTSPVWQARRKSASITAGDADSPANSSTNMKQKTKILNFTLPLCIGYNANMNTTSGRCSSSASVGRDRGTTSSASILRIRSLFARKVD